MRSHDNFTSEAEINAIGQGLRDRTLPKAAWTHRAHLAAAIWLVSHRDAEQAPREMPGLIRAYNEATGVENTETAGYHETITLASLRAAAFTLAKMPKQGLHHACNHLLESPCGDPDWLLAYWSQGCLFSPAARREWVAPDWAPLPF